MNTFPLSAMSAAIRNFVLTSHISRPQSCANVIHAPNFNLMQAHDISSGGSMGLGRSSAINPLEDTYKAGKIFVYYTLVHKHINIQLGRIELELQKQQQCIHV